MAEVNKEAVNEEAVKVGNKILRKKLEELKVAFGGHGSELIVFWEPNINRFEDLGGRRYLLNGEVVGTVIHVYIKNFDKAIDVMMHEYLEHVLKQEFSEPYIILTEMVSKAFADISYFRQEKIINAIATLMKQIPRKQKLEKLGLIELAD